MAGVALRGLTRCGMAWRGVARCDEAMCSIAGISHLLQQRLSRLSQSSQPLSSQSGAAEGGHVGASGGTRQLWPLNHSAAMMKYGHDAGTRFATSLCVTNTSSPLTPHVMRQALTIVSRKVSSTRIGIMETAGALHYYEADSITVDLQELPPGMDVLTMVNQLNAEGFSSDAPPQWKVRYSEAAPDAIRPMPELTAQYPHQYHVILFPNHAVFDAMSFLVVTRVFLDVLDKLLCGEPVDESPIGEFIDFSEVEAKELLVQERLEKEPVLLEELKNQMLACNRSPVLLRAFPPPGDNKPVTKYAYRRIKKDLFDKAHRLSKEKGITFNSFLEAAINTAVVELVTAAGAVDATFDISVTHATSLRRFMQQRTQPIMGLHVASTSHVIPTPSDARANFWELSRTINNNLKKLLQDEATIEQEVVRRLSFPSDPKTHFNSRIELVREYGITNPGSVDPIVPGRGRAVQFSSLVLLAVVHNHWYLCLHQLHTYRGVVSYTLSYPSDYMAPTTADLLMDTVLEVISDVCADLA